MTTLRCQTSLPTRTQILGDEHSFITLIEKMENPALRVVNAARVSYAGRSEEFTEKDKKLTGYLWGHEHTSPFRHSFYTFHISCPLFVFRQWVKYQVGSTWRSFEVDGSDVDVETFDFFFDTDKGCSWNELSGRYAKLEPHFYVPTPDQVRQQASSGSKQKSEPHQEERARTGFHEDLLRHSSEAYSAYRGWVALGVAKEQARMFLPQNIYSQAYWTVSLQGVLHFLHQRLAPDAQWEIQQYAQAIESLIQDDLECLGIT